MRRPILASLLLSLLILPVMGVTSRGSTRFVFAGIIPGDTSESDLTRIGGDETMLNETRQNIIGMITRLFGSWMPFKIEGAQGPTGLFSAEFLAAFFIVYFLLGMAQSFQIQGQSPTAWMGLGGGLPKILMALFFTWLIWNTFGGMRFERLLILMVPPMLVYYILSNVLKNYALLGGVVVQLISITAATIAFLFYSPQLINYLDGRFQYGVLDFLAGSGAWFFVIYIFGFFLTKFTNEVISPLKTNQASTQESINRQIKALPVDQQKKVNDTLGLIQGLQQGGGGG